MNRRYARLTGLELGVPRMRGDEPEFSEWVQENILCSPRERG